MQVAPAQEDEVCVIDSNQLLQECIDEQKKKAAKHRRDKIKQNNHPEPQFDEEGNPIEQPEEEEFVDLEDTVENVPEEPEVDHVALAKQEAEQILAQAHAEADRIVEEAQSRGEAMMSHAEAEGHKEGYQQGYQEVLQKQQEWEQETERQRGILRQEYEQKQQELEHDLVDVICSVVEKVFLIQFGDKKELILQSVDNVLSHVEGSKSFLIRVNEKNAEFLRENKDTLQNKVGHDVLLDIVLDPVLDDAHCMIETDGGLFDCSMDVQMRNLVKDIRSLS
jgi:flagellar assembly protein FliH